MERSNGPLGSPERLSVDSSNAIGIAAVEASEASSSPMERLLDLLTMPPDFVEQGQQKLADAASVIEAEFFSETEKRLVRQAARILNYVAFSDPHDNSPLPDDIVNSTHYGKPSYAAKMNRWDYITIRNKFRLHVLDDMNSQREVIVAEREEEITACINEITLSTPVYQFVRSFLDSPKKEEKTEQPLNSFWKRVRTRQEEDATKRRFGIELDQAIDAHPNAKRHLLRRTQQIDDETMPYKEHSKPPLSAAQRLHRYNMDVIDRKKREELGDMLLEVIDNGLTRRYMVYDNDRQKQLDDACGTGYVSEGITENSIVNSYYSDDSFEARLALSFISKILSLTRNSLKTEAEDGVSANLEAIIERSIVLCVGEAVMDSFNKHYIYSDLDILGSKRTGEYMSEELYIKYNGQRGAILSRSLCSPNHSNFISYDEMLEKKYQTRSYIAYCAPQVGGTTRIAVPVQEGFSSSLVLDHSKADIELVAASYNNGETYSIPGFNRVYHDGRGTEYKIDAENDPYTPCEVTLPASKLSLLTEAYRSIGLEKLAEKLTSGMVVTVKELVDHIISSSVYYVPEVTVLPEGFSLEASVRPDDLESLKGLEKAVFDNTYYTQCTGAHLLLQKSLSILFGKDATSSISGYTFSPLKKYISSEGHIQTIFHHDGAVYILDATPFSDIDFGDRNLYCQDISEGSDTILRPPQRKEVDISPKYSSAEGDVGQAPPKRTSLEMLEELETGLEQQLTAQYSFYNKEQLYKELVVLPEHDPVRRSLALVKQYRNGTIDKAYISSQLSYFRHYETAPVEIKKKLGIAGYTQTTMNGLITVLERLLQIDERSPAASQKFFSIEDL